MLRYTLKKTILIVMLLSSTMLTAAKTSVSLSDPSGEKAFSATSIAMVYVDPQNTTKDIDETFTVDIVLADVENLYGVYIPFQWDPTILEYTDHTAKIPVETYPDGILHEPGITFMDTVDPTAGTYTLGYACLDPAPAFYGTGIAFNLTFRVKKAGGCLLEFPKDNRTGLPLIKLSDIQGEAVKYDSQDGYFETVGTPQASFTYQPQIGVVGKPISFNASESNTPSGTIVAYYWDFADGNKTASTNAEITHAYNDTGLYGVSLIVENNVGVNSSKIVEQVIIVESRNIKIISIWLSTNVILINNTVQANVTVTNTGYKTENSTLTAYYNNSATEWTKIAATNVTNLKSGITKLYGFTWDTTGVEAEKYYVIKVNATLVPYDDEADNTKISEPLFVASGIIHDLAVESLVMQASYWGHEFDVPVILGENALLSVTIKNLGSIQEQAFIVLLSINNTNFWRWRIMEILSSGATKTLTWTWDKPPQPGDYNITAKVLIPYDTNPQNNRLHQFLRVIDTPILNITYTPETLIMNQTITLNASSSVHGDPDGQITSYYWKIFAPGQGLEEIPQYESAESEISVSYNFTEQGNWTIVLRVRDNYGITYSGMRRFTDAYMMLMTIRLKSVAGDVNGDGEVNIFDIVSAASQYQLDPEDPGYDSVIVENADVAPPYNGIIDIYDLVTIAYHYGEKCP
jgi:PKD repeat protein